MYLADSNIIIYSYLSQYDHLRSILINERVYVSEISRVEVLGYHKLTIDESAYYKDVFNVLPVIVPDKKIFDTAIELRKSYNMKLGDSLIAATALVNDLTIYTRNISDFERIYDLKCINIIDQR